MGRVAVKAVIESLEDLYQSLRGNLPTEQARRIDVPDALVDTGATNLSLPSRMIRQLGLIPLKSRQVLTSTGIRTVAIYGAVRLTVAGRDCVCDVTEVDDACPVLIGQVPLELMDLIVDPGRQRLIGNPAHNGEHVLELL